MGHSNTDSPFAQSAWEYVTSGLGMPIPLPRGRKKPPPPNVTGKRHRFPTPEEVDMWVRTGTYGGDKDGKPWTIEAYNVGIRPAVDVVTMDVDDVAALEAMVALHGPLPETWQSTRTGEGTWTGNHWFKVPAGFSTRDFREKRFPVIGMEVVRSGHRFVVVPDSVHETGATYEWMQARELATGTPTFHDLAVLPVEWAEHLIGACHVKKRNPAMSLDNVSASGQRKGAVKILRAKAYELAEMEPDTVRNNTLNEFTFGLVVNFVIRERSLTAVEVAKAMEAAALMAGLDVHEVRATIDSALDGAAAHEGVTT